MMKKRVKSGKVTEERKKERKKERKRKERKRKRTLLGVWAKGVWQNSLTSSLGSDPKIMVSKSYQKSKKKKDLSKDPTRL